jgi:hypothetical protein
VRLFPRTCTGPIQVPKKSSTARVYISCPPSFAPPPLVSSSVFVSKREGKIALYYSTLLSSFLSLLRNGKMCASPFFSTGASVRDAASSVGLNSSFLSWPSSHFF